MRRFSTVWLAMGTVACAAGHDMASMGAGHGSLPAAPTLLAVPGGPFAEPASPVNASAAPGVVELTLTAAPATQALLPGKPAAVWAYNGTVPGPTLRAKVGDQIVVHFKNNLPESTTIHWHGMRVPANMDGMVEIKPGATYDYTFKALDAGTYWYHPHMATAKQVERGLYGAVVIDDGVAAKVGASEDRVAILDDVLIKADSGQLDESTNARIDMMGREGNLALVNGAPAGQTLTAAPGARILLRLVNAANARYFKLAVPGGKVTQVGGDRGLLDVAAAQDSLLLVPGQRAMVVAEVPAGAQVTLRAEPYERAASAGKTPGADLLMLAPSAEAKVVAPALPVAPGSPPAAPGAFSVTRSIVLNEAMDTKTMAMKFTINGKVFPNVPPIAAKPGDIQAWDVENASEMDHPFHVHGFFFWRQGDDQWRDTVNVVAKSKRRFLVQFDDRAGAAGMWVYHCHILEHADAGMIGTVQLQ